MTVMGRLAPLRIGADTPLRHGGRLVRIERGLLLGIPAFAPLQDFDERKVRLNEQNTPQEQIQRGVERFVRRCRQQEVEWCARCRQDAAHFLRRLPFGKSNCQKSSSTSAM